MKLVSGAVAAIALLATLSVANAEGTVELPKSGQMDCSDAGMTNANASMMKMSDATKKEMAMKEMGMAKDMMAKKDMAGCKMHMDKAMGMMK